MLEPSNSISPLMRFLALMTLFATELLILALAYQFFAKIECQATQSEALCRGLRSLVARALALFAVVALLLWARPSLIKRFSDYSGPEGNGVIWAFLHGLGVVLLMLPLFIFGGADMSREFPQMAPFWAVGAITAAFGGALWIAPLAQWRFAAGPDLGVVCLALCLGVLLPDIADLILPIWWHLPQLTTITFEAVAAVLHLSGREVYVDPPSYIIGVGDFFVHIAQQCSGVEGLALITAFTAIYAMLFRDQIRPLRFWLTVLPLGLLASWTLNVLRIAILVLLGDMVSPELAVNGFHSYAGWLFFILLTLGLMWFVNTTPWLHRETFKASSSSMPLREDWLAARIIPFIAFMISSTLAAALFQEVDLGYPLKTVAMAAALIFFLPALRQQPWPQPSLEAILCGIVVGVVWILAAGDHEEHAHTINSSLSSLSAIAFFFWSVARLTGTILLVPLVEELFFRGYILTRLDRGGQGWRTLALAVSSITFGLLHEHWILGILAGLAFGLLMLRRKSLSDAVWAHVIANAVLAILALYHGDWTLS